MGRLSTVIIVFVLVAIGFLGLFGWVMNIFKLVQADFQPPYKEEVLRIIGVPVAPMGAIEGFIKIND